jgi:hypothetical protein
MSSSGAASANPLEKVACGAFSDSSFGPAAKGATFAAFVAQALTAQFRQAAKGIS